MKRLFIAIKIHPDPNFLEILRSLKRQLNAEKIKWVEEHNMHVTLKFFGDTPEEKIPVISGKIVLATNNMAPFQISLSRTGLFGSSYQPRVIWFGIDPSEKFSLLASNIFEKLLEIGYEPDRQNFVPHLTIGRIKNIKNKKLLQQLLFEYKDTIIQKELINTLYLFESILKPQGPEYKVIDQFNLLSRSD